MLPIQYTVIEAPDESLKFDDNTEKNKDRLTFLDLSGGVVRNGTTFKRKNSVETLFSLKHGETHQVRLKESFKEKLLEENKKRALAADPYASSQHDSSGMSSNGEIADRMNQQLLVDKIRRKDKGGDLVRAEVVLSGDIDHGENKSKNMVKGNKFYDGWRSIMGGNATIAPNNKA